MGVGCGTHKKFSIWSFEMLNFYAFWTLEQEDLLHYITVCVFRCAKNYTAHAVGNP